MKKLLSLSFLPLNANAGLLVLRLLLGLPMLCLHGWPKLEKLLAGKAQGFPDPLNIGSTTSLSMAVLAEVAGSVLLITGWYGRLGAFMLASTMLVAWAVTHGMHLSGEDNGELAFIYLAGFVTLLLAGMGKYSVQK